MDIRATFLPVGEELIDNVFPTSITYIRNLGSSYDPSTGEVTQNTEQFSIKAGVLSRGRSEEGGVGETYETPPLDPPRGHWGAAPAQDRRRC